MVQDFVFFKIKTRQYLYFFYSVNLSPNCSAIPPTKKKVFRVSDGSNEGYDLSKTNATEFNLVISIIPVIASYITLCIMRSFLSQVERTPKGKASVNNKHVTCDLLSFN